MQYFLKFFSVFTIGSEYKFSTTLDQFLFSEYDSLNELIHGKKYNIWLN